MSIYDELQPVATEVLTEFNQGIIEYVKVVSGTGPVDNPGPPTETAYRMQGAVRGVSLKYVQEGLAQASDLQATLAINADVIPDLKGFVQVDGQRYKVVQVMKIPEAGTPVAYRLIFRR